MQTTMLALMGADTASCVPGSQLDEVVLKKYARHIIRGLEYLHAQGQATPHPTTHAHPSLLVSIRICVEPFRAFARCAVYGRRGPDRHHLCHLPGVCCTLTLTFGSAHSLSHQRMLFKARGRDAYFDRIATGRLLALQVAAYTPHRSSTLL